MGIIKDLLAGGTSKLVDSIGKVIDENITNKGEMAEIQLKIDQEVNRHMEVLQTSLDDIEKAYLQDVASARSLQISALNQADTFSKRFLYYLAAFIILSATAFGMMLFFVNVPEENKRLVEMFADVYLFAGGAVGDLLLLRQQQGQP